MSVLDQPCRGFERLRLERDGNEEGACCERDETANRVGFARSHLRRLAPCGAGITSQADPSAAQASQRGSGH
jgi:hypothetical protein